MRNPSQSGLRRSYRPAFLYLAAFFLIQLTCSTTCTKQNGPTGQRAVNPFQTWISITGDTTHVTLHPNTLVVELGYSFISATAGTVVQLGIRLPDTGRTYTVTLWDGITKTSLAQQNVKVATTGFNYASLSAANAAVPIQANHQYVVSVLMAPVGLVGAGPAGDDFFDVERNDRKDIFPMTVGPITYQYQYSQTTTPGTPVFPANLTLYQYLINGICDIGFTGN